MAIKIIPPIIKTLRNISKQDYTILQQMGFLFEFHPEATGNWKQDRKFKKPKKKP